MVCFVNSGRRIKTDTTVPLGNSRQPALTPKVSMLGSVSTTENIFGRLHEKNPMDAAHKSPCVICLGTFVTSAGACDFIALALYFSNLAGFEAQHSPWPTLEEPERQTIVQSLPCRSDFVWQFVLRGTPLVPSGSGPCSWKQRGIIVSGNPVHGAFEPTATSTASNTFGYL